MTVAEYIKKQPNPQKQILNKLRRILKKTFPKIKEEMYVGVPWYGGKFYLVKLKDHVNFGASIMGLPQKDITMFEGAGKYMRHLKFRDVKDINEKELVKVMKLIMKKAKVCNKC